MLSSTVDEDSDIFSVENISAFSSILTPALVKASSSQCASYFTQSEKE